ncbi:MAG: hypothetical protein GXP63_04910 [DPANN group archaeon]|nr:hypothetical protein [DPANN group archaeon]
MYAVQKEDDTMRYGIILTAGLAILMLFLAGCSSGTDAPSLVTGRSFNGGTDGIKMDFMSNAPPPTVFDTSDSVFDVSLRLQNLGEYQVEPEEATVQIIGIDPGQFSLADPVQNPSGTLYGVRLDPQGNVIPGTIMTVDFFGLHWSGNQLTGSVPYQISASLCYQYETKAIAKLCLKPDLLTRPRASDVCDVTRAMNPESSGAPIRVENLKQSAVGKNKLTFSFQIQHVGTGEIFTNEAGAAVCDDSRFSNEDKVKVSDSILSGLGNLGTISCPGLSQNDGYVKLFDGKATISCTAELSSGAVSGNFERALDINLIYNYREIESVPIMVRHIEDEG